MTSTRKEVSPAAKFLASVAATTTTYPLAHIINTSILRWQASAISLSSMTAPKLYETVFKQTYRGISFVAHDAISLFNGAVLGLLNKGYQNAVRYPAQGFFLKLMKNSPYLQENLKHKELMDVMSGTLAGITEAICCQWLDTLKTIAMASDKKLSLRELAQIAWEKNINLNAGIIPTIFRNGFGGGIQFGAYSIIMKNVFGISEGMKPTSAQAICASYIAMASMIFLTMPFDNKKIRAQLTLDQAFQGASLFSLFKGAIPKTATKAIVPSITFSLINIFSLAIDDWLKPQDKLLEKSNEVANQCSADHSAAALPPPEQLSEQAVEQIRGSLRP